MPFNFSQTGLLPLHGLKPWAAGSMATSHNVQGCWGSPQSPPSCACAAAWARLCQLPGPRKCPAARACPLTAPEPLSAAAPSSSAPVHSQGQIPQLDASLCLYSAARTTNYQNAKAVHQHITGSRMVLNTVQLFLAMVIFAQCGSMRLNALYTDRLSCLMFLSRCQVHTQDATVLQQSHTKGDWVVVELAQRTERMLMVCQLHERKTLALG